MNEETLTGMAVGGLAGGAVAGAPGMFLGSALGGVVGHAYSQKPVVQNFATSMQNDLAPETVTLDAHQIWLRITQGPGSATLTEASAAASQLAGSFANRMSQIAAARSAAAEAWQGNASSAADAATTPLVDSFTLAQQQLVANHEALITEITAFDHIRSQVEFVPETPPQNHALNSANPFQTDLDAAINEYNAKAAKNIQLYEAYSAETAAARAQVPQSYAQPAPLSASSASAASSTGSSPIGAESVAPPQPGGAPAGGQPAGTNASAAPGGGAPKPPSPGGASGGMPGGGTSGQGASATDQTARPPAATPMPPGSVRAASNTVASGPLPSQARSTGASDLQRKTAGAGGGLGGVPGGVGAIGGGSGGGGVRTGGNPALRGGAAVGTGPGAGQPASGPAVNRGPIGGPGARGAAGLGGMPAAPGGRADGEEDQEHRRKYLIEPDDKDLFGVDEQYVNPVIGDNR